MPAARSPPEPAEMPPPVEVADGDDDEDDEPGASAFLEL